MEYLSKKVWISILFAVTLAFIGTSQLSCPHLGNSPKTQRTSLQIFNTKRKVTASDSNASMAIQIPYRAAMRSSNPHQNSKMGLLPINSDKSEPRSIMPYGKLPMAFEVNQGQTDEQVKFISRGAGYTLFLTSSEAVLALTEPQRLREDATALFRTGAASHAVELASRQLLEPGLEHRNPAVTALTIKLLDSNPVPQIKQLKEFPGKTNYLIGNDPEKWQTNVPTYAKIKYQSVYPGVDLIFYGRQRHLELDFEIAPGGDANLIRLGINGGRDIERNPQGDLVVHVPEGKILLHSPRIYQQLENGTVEIAGNYVIQEDRVVSFRISKYDKTKSLVIDPVLSYSTYLGGSKTDRVGRVAVDSGGNAYVTGYTTSADFPTTENAHQPIGSEDVFVAKLNASGTSLVYSTYLGGSGVDRGIGVAVDSVGNAYLTGQTFSTDFPTVNALQPTNGTDFSYKSTDEATSWVRSGKGIVGKIVSSLAIDPKDTSILYACTNGDFYGASMGEVFKSTDGGTSWKPTGLKNYLYSIAIDPITASTIYVGTGTGLYKSTNGGTTWQASGLTDTFVRSIAFDPITSSTVYAGTGKGLFKSTNGGTSWTPINSGLTETDVYSLAIDPRTPSTLYAGVLNSRRLPGGPVFKSTDGGTTWVGFSSGPDDLDNYTLAKSLVIDPVNPSTLYAGIWGGGIYKSIDGGNTWTAVKSGLGSISAMTLAIDPQKPSTLYVGSYEYGVFKTINGGSKWTPTQLRGTVQALIIDPTNPTTLYAGNKINSDAFLTKINPEGNSIIYSTYFGGNAWDYASRIALDSASNSYISGTTESRDFPTANPLQTTNHGSSDVFLAKLDLRGSSVIYSTYIGGGSTDESRGLAVDAAGNAYVTGYTTSTDFPTTSGAFQTSSPGGGYDAFVTKMNSQGTAFAYSTYLGGSLPDFGEAIAVDKEGNAYITGETYSYDDFPLTLHAFQGDVSSSFTNHGFVSKLNLKGTDLVYSTYLASSGNNDLARGIAVDRIGNAYISGSTVSGFPIANAFQPTNGSGLFKSTNGGLSWGAMNYDFPDSLVKTLVIDPVRSSTLYVGTAVGGVSKSTNGGNSWNTANTLVGTNVASLAIDPTNTSIVYAATSGGLYRTAFYKGIQKSTDGGLSWTPINEGASSLVARCIAVDPKSPTTLFACTAGIVKSTNGGSNWNKVMTTDATVIAIDPISTSTVYAGTDSGIFKSPDGGGTWAQAVDGLTFTRISSLAIDPTAPSTLYAGTAGGGVFKSINGGGSWTAVNSGLSNDNALTINALAIDPKSPSTLYLGTYDGLFKSTDSGKTWIATGFGLTSKYVTSLAVDPSTPSTVYVVVTGGVDAYVTKLDPNGSSLVYSTYLGGSGMDKSWDIALDSSGSVYVAGETYSTDFPIYQPFQATPKGDMEGFITKIRSTSDDFLAASDGAICAGNTLHLKVTSIPGATYQWTGPNGFTSNLQNPAMASAGLEASGIYRVVANVGGITYGPTTTRVSVSPRASPPPIYYPKQVSAGATGFGAGFPPSVTVRRAFWTITNGMIESGQGSNTIKFTPGEVGTMIIRAVALDVFGCQSAPSVLTVTVTNPAPSPEVTTGDASSVASIAATLNGSVIANGSNTSVWFEWGTSSDSTEFTSTPPQSIGAGSISIPVNLTLTGLSPNTTYYYRTVASNAFGTPRGLVKSFFTSERHSTFFSQFANGANIVSSLILVNPSKTETANGTVDIFNDDGEPVPLAKSQGSSSTDSFNISPLGLVIFTSDGAGASVTAGSARVNSNIPVAGVVRFSLPSLGIAGVGESIPLSSWMAPIVKDPIQGLSTGVAISNPQSTEIEAILSLQNLDGSGVLDGTALEKIPARGHLSKFVEELFPVTGIADFQGTLVVTTTTPASKTSGTALQIGSSPGQFTTLPVVPIDPGLSSTQLIFPQFATGSGYSSSIFLINPQITPTSGNLRFFDDNGNPLPIALAGQPPLNQVPFGMQPWGGAVLKTGGGGSLIVGSARVNADRALGGVLRFSSTGLGLAGVGASDPVFEFIIPVIRTATGGLSTGVAITSAGSTVMLNLILRRGSGDPVINGQRTMQLPANGHMALFVEELFPSVDTHEFQGTLTVTADGGKVAATAIQIGSAAGQFTTLPVTPLR